MSSPRKTLQPVLDEKCITLWSCLISTIPSFASILRDQSAWSVAPNSLVVRSKTIRYKGNTNSIVLKFKWKRKNCFWTTKAWLHCIHFPEVSLLAFEFRSMIPQKKKILPPILWLIVAYDVDKGDNLVFSVPCQSYIGFLPRRNVGHWAMKTQNGYVTSLRQPLTNSKHRLMRGRGILAAMGGLGGWLGGRSRIWRLKFADDLILWGESSNLELLSNKLN